MGQFSVDGLRKASRCRWSTDSGDTARAEEINIGSLQRIADACELMAKDREQMERSLAWQTKLADRRLAELETERNRVAGLRGYIARLKKKLATAEGGK